jgi:hypothetical protein
MLQARRISASAAHGARSVVRIFYVGCPDGRNFYRQASLRRQSYAQHFLQWPVEQNLSPTVMRTLLLIAIGSSIVISVALAQAPRETLRSPTTFATIDDVATRSRALFDEAAKVITSPRCLNCHPANDRPTQGNDLHPHLPFATRGEGGVGVPGNTCRECHTDVNFSLKEAASYQSIPGNPRWGLAPIEMAWQGKTVREICQQLKDPSRNGNRDLALVHEHAAGDGIVAWGWQPGEGREPAPGTQQIFGDLIQAWIDTGAECP